MFYNFLISQSLNTSKFPLNKIIDQNEVSNDSLAIMKLNFLFNRSDKSNYNSTETLNNGINNGNILKCGTPIVLELLSNLDSYSKKTKDLIQSTLLDRPSYNNELIFISSNGIFRIHYSISANDSPHIVNSADSDNHGQGIGVFNENNAPDYVENISEALVNSWEKLVGEGDFQFNDPPRDLILGGGWNQIDIYCWDINAPGTTSPTASSFSWIHLDVDLSLEAIKTTSAHELFHVIQFGYSIKYADEKINLFEATAECAEDVIYDEIDNYIFNSNYYLYFPMTSLLETTSNYEYATSIFFKFVMEHYGKDLNGQHAYLDNNPHKEGYDPVGLDAIRLLWETYANNDNKTLEEVFDIFFQKYDESFSIAFQKWSFTNYTKDLGDPFVEKKFDYLEDEPYYSNLLFYTDQIFTISPQTNNNLFFNNSIENWANNYIKLTVDPSINDFNIVFNGENDNVSNPNRFNHITILMLKDYNNDGNMDELVDQYIMYANNANDHEVYFLNENFDEIVINVGSAKNGGNYNLDISVTEKQIVQIQSASLNNSSFKPNTLALLSAKLSDNLENASVYFRIKNGSKIYLTELGGGNYEKEFNVPPIQGLYDLKVYAEKDGFSAADPLSLELVVSNPNEGHDFMAKTFSINRSNISPGKSVKLEGSVKNNGIYQELNVPVRFNLKDPNGNIIDFEEELISLSPGEFTENISHTLQTSTNSPLGIYTAEIKCMLNTDFDQSNDFLTESVNVGNIDTYNQYWISYLGELTKNVPYTANGYTHTITTGPGTLGGVPATKVKVTKSGYSSEKWCLVDQLTFFDNNKYVLIFRASFESGKGDFDYGITTNLVTIEPNQLILDAGSTGNYYVSSGFNNPSLDQTIFGDDGDVVDPWLTEYNNTANGFNIKVSVPLNAQRKTYSFWPNINGYNGGDIAQILSLVIKEPHNVSGLTIFPPEGNVDTIGKPLNLRAVFKNNGGYTENNINIKLEINGQNDFNYLAVDNINLLQGQIDTVDFLFNTLELIPGEYSIKVSAILNNDPYNDNHLMTKINLVEAPNQNPIVYLIKPSSNELIYTENIELECKAFDHDGEIDSVVIKLNDAKWIKAERNNNNIWSLNSILIPDSNIIFAKAFDNRGAFASDTVYVNRIKNLPILNLVYPNGGEIINTNSLLNISWLTENVENISVLLSIDSGKTFSTIVSNISVDSTLSFITPDEELPYCLIKIIDLESNIVFDVSDSVFSISYPTTTEYNLLSLKPDKYELFQNYPNPFNPSTTIRFSIPEDSPVSIKLFNILGEEIKIILNNELKSGIYSIQVMLGDLTSGIYFYRIETSKFISTKKMLLIK